MFNTILKNWSFMRFLRLAVGLFILYDGIQSSEGAFIAFGIVFTLMPVLNIGCCGVNGCDIAPESKTNSSDKIEYEKVE